MAVIHTNPFAGCGRLPGKEDLIGRTVILQNITTRLQRGRNLALYGMLHVGKSSVLHAGLLEQKPMFQRDNILFVMCDLPSLIEVDNPEAPEQFFHALVEQCMLELEESGMASDILRKCAHEALEKGLSWGRNTSLTQRFFQKVDLAHLRIVFLLENFDHITEIFQQKVAPFARLQQLSSSTRSVRFITASFHPLKEIVPAVPSLSSLINGFDQLCLGLFDEHDMHQYFARLSSATTASISFPITAALQEQITDYCGRHPYLLLKLGYELAEHFLQTGEVNLERAVRETNATFLEYAMNLKSTLRPEQLALLIQATTSTKHPVSQNIQVLEKYGLIRPNPSTESTTPAYIAFLPHLQEYLQTSQRRVGDGHTSGSQTMYPGEFINERYRMVEHLETNRHNQVVKALDKELRRYVVLKRLHLSIYYGERDIQQGKENLRREAEIQADLRHEYIAVIYDIIDDFPTIAMEWIEGQTLDRYWQQGLAIPEVVLLGYKLARALRYLHRRLDAEGSKITHRDIKPQNIMIRPNGDPVLIDFGIARAPNRVSTLHSYDEQGNAEFSARTPDYAAPEQQENPRQVTDRTDIYALGLVLYETLTAGAKLSGQLQPDQPFDERIPVVFWNMLCAMLSEDPQTRPEAGQLCQELERCLQLLSIPF